MSRKEQSKEEWRTGIFLGIVIDLLLIIWVLFWP